MDSRQELLVATDKITQAARPGQENEVHDAILTLVRANPNDQGTRDFITSFEQKRGKPVGG